MSKRQKHELPKINAYWWTDIPNFGDRLVPHLVKHFADVEVIHKPIQEADHIFIGSVLEHVPHKWNGIIAGAGRLLRNSKLNLDNARVLGVRGPLSAKGLGDVAIGDPALLADELVDIYTRDIEIGIVPHWSDTRLAHDFDGIMISPWNDPIEVIKQIGRCKRIITSSLHGTIVADAFGVPRRVEIPLRMIYDPKEGGTFKFEDYHASINMKFQPGKWDQANYNYVADRKSEVYDMLRKIDSR